MAMHPEVESAENAFDPHTVVRQPNPNCISVTFVGRANSKVFRAPRGGAIKTNPSGDILIYDGLRTLRTCIPMANVQHFSLGYEGDE